MWWASPSRCEPLSWRVGAVKTRRASFLPWACVSSGEEFVFQPRCEHLLKISVNYLNAFFLRQLICLNNISDIVCACSLKLRKWVFLRLEVCEIKFTFAMCLCVKEALQEYHKACFSRHCVTLCNYFPICLHIVLPAVDISLRSVWLRSTLPPLPHTLTPSHLPSLLHLFFYLCDW